MNRIEKKTSLALTALVLGGAVPASAQEARGQEPPPAPLPMQPVEFPEFHERTLDNGVRVVIVENHEQPVVSVNLRLASGAKYDPPGRGGVAGFTAALLDKGTTTRTAEQIAERIDFVGGSLGAGVSDDWISVGTTVLTEFLDTALVLMSDIVLNPTFPEDELETERMRTLSGLQASLGQPSYLAQRRFLREIYGDHPYGAAETPESVRAITREDLVAFHDAHFRPENALLVVAGAVDPDRIGRRLERHFGDWSGAAAEKASLPAPPERTSREIVFVHKPGAVQAVIRFGHLMPPAANADWVRLDVAQQILGGGTTGWFFQTLRQEKGYTYGAYTSTAKRLEPGYFVAAADVRNEVVDSALVEFFRLIEKLRAEPVAAADLRTARDFMTGSFPLSIETPQQVAGQVANARLLGLPDDYLATYRDRVAAVTADDVQRVAREYIRPDEAVLVVVGDATQILDRVAPFGDVRLLDENGEPLDAADLEVRGADVAFDGSAIEAGTRVYDVMFQGNAMAEYTVTTERVEIDGVPAVRAASTMDGMGGGLAQEVVFEAATLRPFTSTMEQRAGANTVTVELRLEGNQVLGTMTTAGQSREVSIDAAPGMLLPGMDAFALMAVDLTTTPRFRVPMFDAMSGAVTTITFEVVGETTVTVAAGEFEAYEIEVSGGPATERLFVRKAAPHILIKQQVAGQPISVELREQS